MNKYQQMELNLINGNISDYTKALKKLSKTEIILYTRYLFDKVVCDTALPSKIYYDYIEKYL